MLLSFPRPTLTSHLLPLAPSHLSHSLSPPGPSLLPHPLFSHNLSPPTLPTSASLPPRLLTLVTLRDQSPLLSWEYLARFTVGLGSLTFPQVPLLPLLALATLFCYAPVPRTSSPLTSGLHLPCWAQVLTYRRSSGSGENSERGPASWAPEWRTDVPCFRGKGVIFSNCLEIPGTQGKATLTPGSPILYPLASVLPGYWGAHMGDFQAPRAFPRWVPLSPGPGAFPYLPPRLG